MDNKDLKQELIDVPVFNNIDCSDISEYIKLPTSLIPEDDYFLLKVEDVSLIDLNILKGDIVLITKNFNDLYNKVAVISLANNKVAMRKISKDEINLDIVGVVKGTLQLIKGFNKTN